MRRRLALPLAVLLPAVLVRCSLVFATSDLRGTSDAAVDAPTDAVVDALGMDAGAGDGACRDDLPFTVVTRIDELSTPTREGSPRLLPDELTIYFQRLSASDAGFDLWVAKRASRSAKFEEPTIIAELSSPASDTAPAPTADGLTMYFSSNRDTDGGLAHLYRTGRNTLQDPFGLILPVPSTLVDAQAQEVTPFIDGTGGELFYASDFGTDASLALWSARVVSGIVQTPAPLALPLSAAAPAVTADGKTLYFSLNGQIVYAERVPDGGFAAPQPAPGLGSSAADRPGWISPNRCRLYFGRNADVQNTDLFVAERAP